jgi:hypothetical protein
MSDHEFRLVHPHDDLGEGAYHQPVHLNRTGDNQVNRDAIGRRRAGAYHRWLRLICNNPECTYESLVRADVVEQVAARHEVAS